MESDSLLMKNVSFIKARDPSILLAFNRPQLAEIKTKLADQFAEQVKNLKKGPYLLAICLLTVILNLSYINMNCVEHWL